MMIVFGMLIAGLVIGRMGLVTQYPGIGTRGIVGSFFARLQDILGTGWAQKISFINRSDQATETYKWLGAVPPVREWSGSRGEKQLRETGLTITNRLYEDTLRFSTIDRRRDKTGQIMQRVNELAKRVAEFPHKLLTNFISSGDGSTYGTTYDGQYMFDTDHSFGDSGTLKNLLTSSEVGALNVTTATDPTPAEMALAIGGMIAYFYTFKDDSGEPIHGDAKEFLVMVPPTMLAAALAGVKNTYLLGASGSVSESALKATDWRIGVVPNARLTWTDKIAIFRTDGDIKPFILQEEQPVSMEVLAEGSDQEFKEKMHSFSAEWMGYAGYAEPLYALRGTFS